MKKKTGLAALLLAAACLFSGCGADKTLYREMESLQKQTAALKSGIITLTVQFEESGVPGEYAAELTFSQTEDGTYAYCQKQFDQNEQVVFCEYSDGKSTKQWLIGRGWEEIGSAQFTKETPHRYLQMISSPYERKMIQNIKKEEDEGGTRYILAMNASRLSKACYPDGAFTVSEQTVTLSFDPEGKMIGYSENTILKQDGSGTENSYRVDLSCKEHNAVSTIEEPKLREYFGQAK